MFLRIGVIVLMACMASQVVAQSSTDQDPGKQAPENQQTSSAASAKVEYPLDTFRDFSAIMSGGRGNIGEPEGESHIYRSGDLMRVEGPEKHGYFITNLKTLETWGIMEGPCAYSKHPYFGTSPFPAARPGTTVERVPAGKETFEGH